MKNDHLSDARVMICVGTGGVGKTTTAAALGLYLARRGKKVLVLTIDPARRLATALGLEGNTNQPTAVPLGENTSGGEMYACMVDTKSTFDKFVTKHAENSERVQKILQNRLYQQLSGTLSGSQEFTSMERLLEFHQDERFDVVILDTPPTQHAEDFLQAPKRLHDFFQSSIVKWFAEAKPRSNSLIRQVFQKGTAVVMKTLEKMTGSQFIHEIMQFFSAIGDWNDLLRSRSQAVHDLLREESTQFLLVTSFDRAKLTEARTFGRSLVNENYHLGALVVNRVFPNWLHVQGEGTSDDNEEKKLIEYYTELKDYYSDLSMAYEELKENWQLPAPIWKIPDFDQEIDQLTDLNKVAQQIEKAAQRNE